MSNEHKFLRINNLDPLKVETSNKHRLWNREVCTTRSSADAKRIVYTWNALKDVERPLDFVKQAKENAENVKLLSSEIEALKKDNFSATELLKSIKNLIDTGSYLKPGSIVLIGLEDYLKNK